MARNSFLLILSIFFFSNAYSVPISFYVDDRGVKQDEAYTGCIWKHCISKAKKLKKNYLKELISLSLMSGDEGKFVYEGVRDRADLAIVLKSHQETKGRGVSEFVVGNLTAGAAPIKIKVGFNVVLEYKADTNRGCEFWITKKRNVSVASDTQRYKEDAAREITRNTIKFISGEDGFCLSEK